MSHPLRRRLASASVVLAGLALAAFASAQKEAEPRLLLEKATKLEQIDGDLKGAMTIYQRILGLESTPRDVTARALLRLGECHEKQGDAEARTLYERLVREFGDQAEEAAQARARLAALGGPDRSLKARRVWEGGINGLSPDGRYVVYVGERGGYRVKDLRTGEDGPITDEVTGRTFNYSPVAVSPDDRLVAYTTESGGANELRLCALDGSATRVLHRSADRSLFLLAGAFMPDARTLVVLESDGYDWRRGLLDSRDGSIRYVGERQRRRFTRWGVPSPDGRYIAFDVGDSDDPLPKSRDVFVYDTATARDAAAASGPNDDRVVGWSSESELLFARSAGSSRDVWAVRITGGQAEGDFRLVRRDLGNGEPLHLTPAGVLYQKLFREDVYAFVAGFDGSTGQVSLPARSVNERREQCASPGWSADGLTFLYGAIDPNAGQAALVVRSEASGRERRVPLSDRLNYPQWLVPSPDGRAAAVAGFDKDMSFGVFLVDPSAGTVRLAVDIPKAGGVFRPDPCWSPDGRALYYKRRSPDAADAFLVVRRDLATGSERQVYRGVYPHQVALSPDGTRLAFFHGDPAAGRPFVLVSLDEASGETTELDRVPESVEFQAPAWSADGRHVLYCRKGNGSTDLWWVPAAGGTPARLASLGGSIFTLAAHPKGDAIAYTQKSTVSELWVLENLLSK